MLALTFDEEVENVLEEREDWRCGEGGWEEDARAFVEGNKKEERGEVEREVVRRLKEKQSSVNLMETRT